MKGLDLVRVSSPSLRGKGSGAGERPPEGVPSISRKDSEMDEEIAIECG